MGDKSKPLVSILTPSFNQGCFIQDCLDSVAAQTYRPIEHIVMDGGSTDDTVDILKQSPEHVRWSSEPDRGQSHALNKAFAAAQGDIIGWVNSDDAYLSQTAVARMVTEFQARPLVDVICGDAVMIDSSKRVLRYLTSSLPDWKHFLPAASPIIQPATFIRRSAIERLDQFLREELAVTLDFELWLRLRRSGANFCHLPLPLAVDREHGERKVRTLGERWAYERGLLAQEYSIEFGDSQAGRAKRVLSRWASLPSLLTLRGQDSAIELQHDSRFALAIRQTFISHARISVLGQ